MLTVQGKPMLFFVDSGAERTVLKQIQGVPVSKQKIRVISANGRTMTNSISMPINFRLNNDEKPVQCAVVLSPECPHNLLGRDLILALELAVVPTSEGVLKVIKHDPYSPIQTLVVESNGAPHYWWSLDLPSNDPKRVAQSLVRMAEQRVTGKYDKIDAHNLHVTLWYKRTAGPDPQYDKEVKKLGPQNVHIPYVYWTEQTSFCDADISKEAASLMVEPNTRHISLTKGPK